MAVKTRAQLRQEIAQLSQAGVLDPTTGIYDFQLDTFPTLSQANSFIDDSIRNIVSEYDYTFLETSKSYPFCHTISGVQGVELFTSETISGITTTFASGTIFPYPNSVLNYSWTDAGGPCTDLSGIQYTGLSGVTPYTGTSTSGNVTYGDLVGTLGYTYQLDQDIDKIIAVGIPYSITGQTARGILMTNIDWHDLERLIPNGNITASGTPIYYSEFPGLSPNINNKTIQFFPVPLPIYKPEEFVVHYKKKHVDMTSDSEKQNVIPEQYQYVITQSVLEKTFDLLDNPKSELATRRKNELVAAMRQWDGNQPNKMPHWADFNYNSLTNRLYDNSTVVYL